MDAAAGHAGYERLFYATGDHARRRAHDRPVRGARYSLAASEQRSKMALVPIRRVCRIRWRAPKLNLYVLFRYRSTRHYRDRLCDPRRAYAAKYLLAFYSFCLSAARQSRLFLCRMPAEYAAVARRLRRVAGDLAVSRPGPRPARGARRF